MACNGVLTPPSKSTPQQSVTSPVIKFFNPPFPPLKSSNFLLHPLRLEMAASAFSEHGYFQQAHVHIFEAIITD